MKIFTTNNLRRIFLLLTVMAAGVNAVWGQKPAETIVEDYFGTDTYNGTNLDKVSGGNFTVVNNHVRFTIHDVKYYNVLGVRRLDYNSEQSANTTISSKFEWNVVDDGYSVVVSEVSTRVRAYQAKLSPKSATAQFTDNAHSGSIVDCKTNGTGTDGSHEVKISYSSINAPLYLKKVTGQNSAGYSLHDIKFTYKVTHKEPLFYFEANAESNNTSWGTVEAFVESKTVQGSMNQDSAQTTATFRATTNDLTIEFDGWYSDAARTQFVSNNEVHSILLDNYAKGSTTAKTLYAKFEKKKVAVETCIVFNPGTFVVGTEYNVADYFKLKDKSQTYEINNSDGVVLSSSDSLIVQVSADGKKFTPICGNLGNVTLTASYSGEVGEYAASNLSPTITITRKDDDVVWNTTYDGQMVEGKYQIEIDDVLPYDMASAHSSVDYSFSSTGVVSKVPEGIKGLAAGEITMTATSAGDCEYAVANTTRNIVVRKRQTRIDWGQSFNGFVTQDNHTISETVLLVSTANDKKDYTISDITYSVPADNGVCSVEYTDGNYYLRVFGHGETTITATYAGDDKFAGCSYAKEVVVRYPDDKCVSTLLNECSREYELYTIETGPIFELSDAPADKLTFKAHKSYLSNQNFFVRYRNSSADSWTSKNVTLENGYQKFELSLPEGTRQIQFYTTTGSIFYKYYRDIIVTQKKYLTTDEYYTTTGLRESKTVGSEASWTIPVNYSDLTKIVTESSNPKIVVTPLQEINNSCGDWGTYNFKITVNSDKEENVQGTVVIRDLVGEKSITIPVNVEFLTGSPYYFQTADGTWQGGNWTALNGTKQDGQPKPYSYVVVNKDLVVDCHASAYFVRIETGGSITIAPGASLTIGAGGIYGATSENLILRAGTGLSGEGGNGYEKGSVGTLRISPNSELPMPNAAVELYTLAHYNSSQNGKQVPWQYVGTAVSGATVGSVYAGSLLNKWVSNRQAWGAPKSTAEMAPFIGYSCSRNEETGSPIFTHNGTLINNNQSFEITSSSEEDYYYIFANSYSAPIDLKSMDLSRVFGDGTYSKTIYLYNTGSYETWQSSGDGQYMGIPVGQADKMAWLTGRSAMIPSMQGFMIVCPKGTSGTFRFDYESMVWKSRTEIPAEGIGMKAPSRHADASEADSVSVMMSIQLACAGISTEMYVVEQPNCSQDFDNGYDAQYISGDVELGLYSNVQGEKYSFQSTNMVAGSFIGFNAGTDSLHTLSFPYVETAEPLYLQDLANDSIIEVEQGTAYSFTADSASDNSLRFRLLNADMLPADYWTGNGDNGGSEIITPVVPEEPIVTALNSTTATTALWMSDGSLYATANGASAIVLYDLNGRIIMSRSFRNAGSLSLENLPAGVYMAHSGSHLLKIVR